MHVLMVTKFFPVPANTGGKRRSIAIVEEFLRRGDQLTLLAHDDGSADPGALEERGVRLITEPWRGGTRPFVQSVVRTRSALLGRFFSARLYRRALDVARAQPVDVLQIEHLHNVCYGDLPARLRVIDLHDVVSIQARRIGRLRKGPMRLLYELEALRTAIAERQVARKFDIVACVSDRDAKQLGSQVTCVAGNGWDATEELAPPPLCEETVVLTGNLAFAPNVDAAVWLVTRIWPKVLDRHAAARLFLVGKDPPPRVRALEGRSGVIVTGTVPDVRPYLERARVTVVPLRSGGGSRLKILEALEAGRPVVSTTIGLEGLETLEGKGVVVADQEDGFADAVNSLLDEPHTAIAFGKVGRTAVHAGHLWSSTLRPMFDAIDARITTSTWPTNAIASGTSRSNRLGIEPGT